MTMQKITPHLWFDNNAEQAMNYYTSVFKNSKILNITYYPENAEDEHLKNMQGKVLQGIFEIDGFQIRVLDGGPLFQFNESFSLVVECDDQAELDYLWSKLSAVKESEQCGWCKDKFGLSWQIIPKRLAELMSDPDKQKSARVMAAVMKMHKLDIAELEKAYNGE